MMPQGGVVRADFPDAGFDRLRNGRASSFGKGPVRAMTTAKAKGCAQLVRQKVHLGLCLRGAEGVRETLGFHKLAS
jgi:hypothetical protein